MSPPLAVFYTPLKSPRDPEPSGDREIARGLLEGLTRVGFRVELAGELLTWRRQWDASAAVGLERRAALRALRLIRRYRLRAGTARPRLWVTYQNYHRCPDLLGPLVATALDVPYVLVDTAVSTRSRRTPFRPWASAARLAVRRADLIFAMSPRDLPALARLRGPGFAATRLRLLPPAVDPARFGPRAAGAGRQAAGDDPPVILCVAMMREHDKLASYRLLGAALDRLHAAAPDRPWRLLVAGDGPARPQVEAALTTLPPARVEWAGAVEPDALPALYRRADLFAFPGVGEALGLVYLEAAAAGLPVVACRGPGPGWMVAPGGGILTEPTPDALAAALASLLDDPARRAAMGAAARRFVETERSPETLARDLAAGLRELGLP